MTPLRLASILFAAALPATLAAQAKASVTPKDFGKWESLGAATMSARGEWVAYAVNRVNEENELRIRGGPRDTTIVAAYGSAPAFSVDAKWVAYAVGVSPAERDKLEKDKKPVTHNSVAYRSLATGETVVIKDVITFRFSTDGRFLAMRRYPAEGKHTAELLVQDLAQNTRLTFGNVGDYAWSDGRALLAFTVETEGNTGNAFELWDGSSGVVRVLDSSPSLYRAISWRPKSDDVAALRTIADKQYKDTSHVVLAWMHAASPAPARRELDPAKGSAIATDLRIAEHKRPEWAKDGSTIFIGLRPRERAARADSSADSSKTKLAAEKISDVQVWHSKDVRIMPMQKSQEQQDLQRTLLTAWHPTDGMVVRIGTDLLEMARVLEGARFATEIDRKPYPFGVMFGRPFQDVYVIDVKTGERKKALEKVRYFYGGSATGKSLLSYDGTNYWATDVVTCAHTNLTANVKADFSDRDFDFPHDMMPPSGVAGWTKGDGAVLVYDEYDVWSLSPSGSGGRKLTDGAKDSIEYRFARVARDEDGIDMSKAIYLSSIGKRSKKSGFTRLVAGKGPEQLLFDDARIARLARADSADVFAYTREKFDESPNWYIGGGDLRSAKRASATNAFQGDYAWGKSELVGFSSATGRKLQAALYYPANYDPSKKYPMIVYTYELLSQNLHNYVTPSERNYYDIAVFTADGYFVLEPDIVFRDRDPGMSVLEAVVPAVHAIVARGIVDSARVGHVGHSWGGYEAAFLPTRTTIFAASVAGAPITELISFSGAMHWTPGIAEFDHLETGQPRMGVPYWEDMEAYMRNSPAAKVNDLKTPMLVEVGDADGTVDWHQGLEFYNYARRAGRKDFVLLVYPGEDHGLRKKENQVDYHRRILQWFGHYLKGEPSAKWMDDGMEWLDRKAKLEAATKP
ncbi:MAG: prolyl oligopeptidase family serine peptidase [Gemmatimonadota bacterium]|nr:prolyl oligopeptidase family serine peptidase [Gemmatimonadota bacterium]